MLYIYMYTHIHTLVTYSELMLLVGLYRKRPSNEEIALLKLPKEQTTGGREKEKTKQNKIKNKQKNKNQNSMEKYER